MRPSTSSARIRSSANVFRRQALEAALRRVDDPARIAATRQVVAAIDAGHAVEHPGGGHLSLGPDQPVSVLIDRTASFGATAPVSLTYSSPSIQLRLT